MAAAAQLTAGVVRMGLVYLAGVAVYASGVPESLFPQRFDFFFSSHQWWHVAVVAAATLHFGNVVQLWADCTAEVVVAAAAAESLAAEPTLRVGLGSSLESAHLGLLGPRY